ncbi:MAG TPA: tetratricopeptide repeat protein [Streptosporangiaceae bacterium]
MTQPRDFSLYGAVDLGARKAAAQRAQEASRAGGPDGTGTANGHVFDVTEATFEADVLERSRTVPVVMDLWAEWCGPCKQLSPVLEKLAVEADGAWVLAKVDVDANPQLSAALQVQSIPMVVAVVGGQLVPGFLGALPEAQVRQWLGQLMQAVQQLGMPSAAAGDQVGQAGPGQGPQAPDAAAGGGMYRDPGLAEAQQAMERGDLDGAAAAFEQMLEADPGHPIAVQGLAQVNLFRRVNSYDEAAARREAAGHPDDVDAQSKVADLDLASGRVDDAFDRLLGVVRRTSGEDRDQARRHLIGLFDIFPPGDPRVAKARATLSTLLF